jgi:nucleoside-diphosphate-sugar epimerase
MKIAILGANGFLGRNLSRDLILGGHKVVGFVLNPPNPRDSQVEFRPVTDLLGHAAHKESPFEVVINLAARRSTRTNVLTDAEVDNFTYTIPRAFFLKIASPGSLILNASTYIQNFEGTTGRTVDRYGEAKEKLSLFLEHESSLRDSTILDLYFFTIYGIGDRPNHLVPLLLNAARTGHPIDLSPGNQLMNLLYVDDAVKNLLKCLNAKRATGYQKNFLWSENYFSVRDLVSKVESAVGKSIVCNWGARDYAGHEMMKVWPIPMNQLPSFSETTVLSEGISRIWKASLNTF